MRAVLLAALLAACTQPRSARCRQVCARESECVTQTNSPMPFDEKECIAACAALEADRDNAAKVQQHYECVMKEQACSAVLKCD